MIIGKIIPKKVLEAIKEPSIVIKDIHIKKIISQIEYVEYDKKNKRMIWYKLVSKTKKDKGTTYEYIKENKEKFLEYAEESEVMLTYNDLYFLDLVKTYKGEKIKVKTLKELLRVENNYPLYANFKAKKLLPAIKRIEKTGTRIRIEETITNKYNRIDEIKLKIT